MKNNYVTKLFITILACSFGLNTLQAQEQPSVFDTSINNVEMGTDLNQPLAFSWKINSTQRGFHQSAYQIILSDKNVTVWNSGKTQSSESVLIPYNGKALEAATSY